MRDTEGSSHDEIVSQTSGSTFLQQGIRARLYETGYKTYSQSTSGSRFHDLSHILDKLRDAPRDFARLGRRVRIYRQGTT